MRPRTSGWLIGLFLALLPALTLAPPSVRAFEWSGRLTVITRKLDDPKASVRLDAVRALGEFPILQSRRGLLRATRDTNDTVRLAAARLLVQHRASGVLPVLVEWLSDFELTVRVEAVRLLGQLGNPAAVGPLIRTFGDFEHKVRMAAVAALGRIGSRKAITGILGRLDDPNVKVRRVAIRVLSELTDARSVIPLLGKLNDPARDIRQAAVRALARIGDPRAIPPILRLLKDPDVQVRIAAISALGQLRTTMAAAALIQAFQRSRNVAERRALVKALGRLDTTQARATLIRALFDASLRDAVRDALVTAGAKVVVILARTLRTPRLQPDQATAIVRILRDIGDRRASRALVREFHRGRVPRKEVVAALATCGDTAAVIPLLRVVSGKDREQKRLALQALESIVDRRAIHPLMPVLKSPDAGIRRMAIRILGRLKAREAIPALLEILGRDDRDNRRAAVLALGRIGDPRVGKRIVPLLWDSDTGLRRAALNAVASLKPRDQLAPLLARAQRANTEVAQRALAIDAMGAILRNRKAGSWRAPLQQLAHSKQPGVATAAMSAMAASGDVTFAADLTAYYPKAPRWLKVKVVEVLGYLPSPVTEPVLRQALKDKDWGLRATAAWALGRPGHAGTSALLIQALRDEHLAVRTNAAGALVTRGPPPAARSALRRRLRQMNADPYLLANVVLALGRLKDVASADAIRRLLKYERTNTYLDQNILRALVRMGSTEPELRQLIADRADESLGHLLHGLFHRSRKRPPTTWIGLDLVDTQGHRKRGVPFHLILSDGRVRWSFSDERGQAFEERLAKGTIHYEEIRTLSR